MNCCYAITVVHCMITCCKNVESILINIMIMILIIDDSLENTFIKFYKKRRPHKDHLPQHPRHPTTSICRKGNVTQSIKYYHKTRSTTATKDVYEIKNKTFFSTHKRLQQTTTNNHASKKYTPCLQHSSEIFCCSY